MDTLMPVFPAGFKSRGRRVSVSAEVDRAPAEKKWVKTTVAKSEEQVAQIRRATENLFLFSSLSDEQRGDLIDTMTLVKAEPKQDIIKQNDDGDFFYVIASGRFAVLKSQGGGEPQQVFVYENQGSFGELALMYNAPRAATVRALTEGVLWAVDRATFRHIVLGNAQRERSKREQWLEQVSILSSLTRGERAQVADALKEEDYQPGAHVIRFGEQGDTLYIVVEGEAVASKLVNGTETELGRMQVGEYFGERALLTQEPRAANVRAVGRLRVAVIHRSTFERLLGSVKELMERELERYKPVGPLKTMTDEQLMESMLEDTSALTKRKRLLDRRLAEIRSEKERLSKVLASKGGQ